VIPNLGYAYPQSYEPGYLGVREKKNLIMAGKGTYVRQCKTGYKSKVVKLIERYDEWRSGFSSLFNLKKSSVPSL